MHDSHNYIERFIMSVQLRNVHERSLDSCNWINSDNFSSWLYREQFKFRPWFEFHTPNREPVVGTWIANQPGQLIIFENGKATWRGTEGTWEKRADNYYLFTGASGVHLWFTYSTISHTVDINNEIYRSV